jgi:hypothetical protein
MRSVRLQHTTSRWAVSLPHVSEVQGGAVNRGLKWFFSQYRPSCLIEAYDRPEKYWLVWAGPLASHLFNFNFIFLSDGLTAAAERAACFAYIYRR